MEIVKTDFVAGAEAARGVAVIIDVFRAFSVACYAFSGGAERMFPVAEIDQAMALKKQKPDALMIGEREGRPLSGFDVGNSPSQLRQSVLRGRSIIHTTHAGTQGLVAARNADVVVTGALVNAAATARYIQSLQPSTVTLVRMGWKAESRTDEDDYCADYLEHLLLGRHADKHALRQALLNSPCAQRFLDPNQPWNPTEDLHLCLATDQFDFALQAIHNDKGQLELVVQHPD